MSDEEVTVETSDGQILTAEYKDGHLQIVEVTPFDKNDREAHILPDLTQDSQQTKYMEILDSSKGLVQLDLLNLTLVRCPDDEESYQLVANAEASETGDLRADTVTCVLQSSDTEDHDNQEGSYVMMDGDNGQGSLVFLKSTIPDTTVKKDPPKPALTPTEILEKAKALQKAKALLSSQASSSRGRGRGRKRKSDLPPHHELLASPNFKLYLYSCKMCSFKCNAVKDMWAHKAAEHAGGASRRAGGGRGAAVSLQCARCPFRGGSHSQLMKHVQENHLEQSVTNTVTFSGRVALDTQEVAAADVLVCGACGFESAARNAFRKHIEDEHGATTC